MQEPGVPRRGAPATGCPREVVKMEIVRRKATGEQTPGLARGSRRQFLTL